MTRRHDTEPLVEDWLHRTLDAIPDPIHRYPAIATEANQTPQQRGWLPQMPKWRFQSMFSATKFVAAGAIVALFGGFLLISQPFDQRDGGVPGATQSDESMAVVMFTGTEIRGGQSAEQGTLSETSEGFRLEVGGWENVAVDATDPRMSGLYFWTGTSLEVGGTTLVAFTVELVNDGGRWIGTTTHAYSDDGPDAIAFPDEYVVVLSGMDSYEGLTAYLVGEGDNGWAVEGVIFPGDMPSAPEPAQVDEVLGS